MTEVTNHLHGRLGVFYGGDWVPMAETYSKWNVDIEDITGKCSDARRSELAPDEYDVAIIGAGCVGACVARELAKFSLKVCVLEKDDDVTQGATKGNSGIVHAGYDDAPGSVRAKFCPPGNRMFPQLDRELRFGFQKNGSLVVARVPGDEEILKDLLERGKKNGVRGLKIIGQEEVRKVEPNINPDVTSALYAPDAGIVIPFEFTIAMAENAADNGVEFRCRREVLSIQKNGTEGYVVSADRLHPAAPFAVFTLAVAAAVAAGAAAVAIGAGLPIPVAAGLASLLAMAVLAVDHKSRQPKRDRETVRARFVVNAAGLFSDKVARMVNDESFSIKPRIGEYLLCRRPAITTKEDPPICRHIVFPCPGKMGKGILVQPTLWGNLCLGPTAHDFKDTEKRDAVFDEAKRGETKEGIMKHLLVKCRELIPSIDDKDVIHSFAGVRAKNSTGDWVVRPAEGQPRFIHAAGIDSPGLAGSPAVALEVVRLLKEAGCNMEKNPCFNPNRRPYIIPKGNWKMPTKEGKDVSIRKEHKEPDKNVVCRCELVTESEIVDCLSRSKASTLKVENTQAVRKRTRAGMGWCQGQYCQSRVQDIISRELKKPVDAVPVRAWPESSLLDSQHQYADKKGGKE